MASVRSSARQCDAACESHYHHDEDGHDDLEKGRIQHCLDSFLALLELRLGLCSASSTLGKGGQLCDDRLHALCRLRVAAS